MHLKPTIAIMLDTRHANKQKLYPVKLRATFQVVRSGKKNWIRKYYPLKRYLSKADFKLVMTKPRNDEQRKIRAELLSAEQRATKILDSHAAVTVQLFDRLYNSGLNLEDVSSVFDVKISELDRDGRIGSRDMYRAVKNSVVKFSGGITFYEITVDWIRRYVKWLQSHQEGDDTIKCSPTTIGIYLRHLRAIYNMAMNLKLITRDFYPFGRSGYTIKKTKARKIALSEDDKNRLLVIQDPELQRAADFWMISYYCYGLNMTDIALLKVRDLENDLLIISREKTKHTDSDNELVIPVRSEVKEIIRRHGNKTLNPDDYVFPILTQGLTASQVKNRIKDFTKAINAGLKKIEEKLELKVRLTTYTARHTFAMMALRKGASKEFIQDALGHASMMTTENYLSGFDIEEKKAISAKL